MMNGDLIKQFPASELCSTLRNLKYLIFPAELCADDTIEAYVSELAAHQQALNMIIFQAAPTFDVAQIKAKMSTTLPLLFQMPEQEAVEE